MPLDLSRLEALRNGGAAAFKSKTPLQRGLSDISMENIIPDPSQPRKVFSDETLNELADSIKNQGLIQPLLVRQDRDKFVIITGERRFRALEKIGAKTAKCIVRNDIPSEDIPYVQIAENMKRQDLSVAEIADFICGRINAGDPQTKIAEKLGFADALISKYARWETMPDPIRAAVKDNKIKDIQTAYILDGKYQEMPDAVEKLISDSSFISRTQAKGLSQETGGKLDHDQVYPSSDSSFDQSETDREEDFTATTDQGTSVGEQGTEPWVDELDATEGSVISEGETGIEAEDESPASPTGDTEEKEDFSPPLDSDESTTDSISDDQEPNESEELEEATDKILSKDKPAEFKNPVWLCFCDERDCELLWKRKPKADGFVFVKYEDGTEEEVPAELVRLNRVIEA